MHGIELKYYCPIRKCDVNAEEWDVNAEECDVNPE